MSRFSIWLFADKRALHGAAACRILAGLTILGLLGTNFASRNVLAGPASSWADPERSRSPFPEIGLIAGRDATFVTVFHLVTMALAAAFVLGWHTRISGLLALIGHIALIEQNPILGDQGDNILRIGMIWLLLMHTSAAWSLDAGRLGTRRIPLWFSNVVHNVALCALVAQVLIVYVAAGLFKLEGELWRDGTALYYPLQLPSYRTVPWASDLLTNNEVVLAMATWSALGIQLLFPLLLLHRLTRRVALVLVVGLHLSIAVLMALPWFSLAMVAYDAIFVSTATYAALDERLRRWRSSGARPG